MDIHIINNRRAGITVDDDKFGKNSNNNSTTKNL